MPSLISMIIRIIIQNNMLINTHDITTMIPGNPDGLDILP